MNGDRMEIRQSEGAGVPAIVEPTRSGPVYTPTVDIFETDQAITVLADMPGVEPASLDIELRDNVLTLTGSVTPQEGPKENYILFEHRMGTFQRQFTLSEAIDQSKIDARITDGVLRLELPKVEKARPRQIAVRVA